VTLTLAELYVRQGLYGRARDIYRKLAEAGNETARRRLLELPSAQDKIAVLQELLARIERAKQERAKGR
jgi:lipopolysaccharide biosynthesis regulator YciM